MAEREAGIEQELERQYGLLTDYDRLLGLTIDPLERERYKYNQGIVQENIALLEKGLEGLPGAQVLTAEELLRETVTRKNLTLKPGEQWNFEKLEVGRDVVQTENNSGIVNTGKMGNVNTGSGSQLNIGTQQAQTIYNVGQMVKRERACPRPNNKPPVFGGRDRELAELKEQLKQGQILITALQGLGGIGKTTLAYQAAYELYKEGVFGSVLSSSLTREPNVLAILTNWAQYGDPDFSPGNLSLEELASRAKALLEDLLAEECQGRVLVLLDDVWENGVNTARLLLEACPGEATVLISTRSEDVARSLRAKLYCLEELDEENGKQLLVQYFKGEFEEADPANLAQLSRTLGGYPLALSLAAQRILKRSNRAKALEQQLDEYRQRLPALKEFGELELDQGDQGQDNLTLVLSYSYEELSEEEKARFRALGVIAFEQPFETRMLAALWQVAEAKAEEYAEELDQLALLQTDKASGMGWYRQQPLLQSYARALLNSTLQPPTEKTVKRKVLFFEVSETRKVTEQEITLARYQDYITSVAGQFKELPPEEWGKLSLYLPHIQTVGAELVSQLEGEGGLDDPELVARALTFAENTVYFVYLRRELRLEKWLEMGLTASRKLRKPESEGLFLNQLGMTYTVFGEKEKALHFQQMALSLYRIIKHRVGEAHSLNELGQLYHSAGMTDKALEYYQQALPIIKELNYQGIEGTLLSNIGVSYSVLGQKEKALEYYQQALSLSRTTGDKEGEATALNNIGQLYSALGQKEKALEYLEEALPLLRAVGNRTIEATTLNNIGLVYDNLDQPEKALEYYQQALPIHQAVGDKEGEAGTLNNIGWVWWKQGEQARGLELIEQAQAMLETIGSPYAPAVAQALVELRAKSGQPHED